MRPLLDEEGFAKYRRFRERNAEGRDYTEPFVPFVGERYADGQAPRLVYCGAAIWEREQVDYAGDPSAYHESLAFSLQHMARVGSGACSSTAFWRLFDSASQLVFPNLSLEERAGRTVWTNLSKMGERNLPAPRDARGELHDLDVGQFNTELEQLRPDILLCVSGSALVATGNAVFRGGQRVEVPLETSDTLVKELRTGGLLIWTMHPNRKSIEWKDALVRDLSKIVCAVRK